MIDAAKLYKVVLASSISQTSLFLSGGEVQFNFIARSKILSLRARPRRFERISQLNSELPFTIPSPLR